LKAVTEAIKQVQVRTDKTAAELAIVRYEKELQELTQKLVVAQQSLGGVAMGCGGLMSIFGLLALVVGFSETSAQALFLGAMIVILSGAVLFFGYEARSGTGKKAAPILKRMAWVQQQVLEKRRIVDGG
jgi:hypothetical protein